MYDMETEMVSYKVTMQFTFQLPADEEVRREIYGTIDPGECFEIDLENDSAATLMESDSKVVRVEPAVAEESNPWPY